MTPSKQRASIGGDSQGSWDRGVPEERRRRELPRALRDCAGEGQRGRIVLGEQPNGEEDVDEAGVRTVIPERGI
jgi:hypothetical protein